MRQVLLEYSGIFVIEAAGGISRVAQIGSNQCLLGIAEFAERREIGERSGRGIGSQVDVVGIELRAKIAVDTKIAGYRAVI